MLWRGIWVDSTTKLTWNYLFGHMRSDVISPAAKHELFMRLYGVSRGHKPICYSDVCATRYLKTYVEDWKVTELIRNDIRIRNDIGAYRKC